MPCCVVSEGQGLPDARTTYSLARGSPLPCHSRSTPPDDGSDDLETSSSDRRVYPSGKRGWPRVLRRICDGGRVREMRSVSLLCLVPMLPHPLAHLSGLQRHSPAVLIPVAAESIAENDGHIDAMHVTPFQHRSAVSCWSEADVDGEHLDVLVRWSERRRWTTCRVCEGRTDFQCACEDCVRRRGPCVRVSAKQMNTSGDGKGNACLWSASAVRALRRCRQSPPADTHSSPGRRVPPTMYCPPPRGMM